MPQSVIIAGKRVRVMHRNGSIKISPVDLEAAAKWHARLASDDAKDIDIEQHMDWLLESPLHAEAYERISQTMRDMEEAKEAARARYASDFDDRIVKIRFREYIKRSFEGRSWPRITTVAAAAAALLFIMVVPNTEFYDDPSKQREYVATGNEVVNYKLVDGSKVALFAGAHITVTMAGDARRVNLHSGRAFFDVISDRSRPFFVNAGEQQVRVVGTRFEVLRGLGFERISVNKGLVAVTNKTEAGSTGSSSVPEALLLEPGVVALYSKEAIRPTLLKQDATLIGSWSEGVLAFEKTKLGEVIDQINDLFPERSVRLSEDSLSEAVFSGTLVVSSAEIMATQLAGFLNLSVTVHDTGISLSSM